MSSIGNGESGLSSASSYVETYMDSVESLPDDMQRDISQMRELDMLYQEKLREIGRLIDTYHRRKESSVRKRCLIQIQRCLVKSQEFGDEKLQHVSHMMDMVDTKSRQVEIEMESAELRSDQTPILLGKQEIQDSEAASRVSDKKRRRPRQEKPSKDRDVETPGNMTNLSDTSKQNKKKKLKGSRKKNKENNSPTPDVPIDPNEPTYCLCNQVSYGEMIGCDNEGCEIEWFHFQCVNLTSKPKGRWYCPKCSQERKQKKTEKSERNEKSDK